VENYGYSVLKVMGNYMDGWMKYILYFPSKKDEQY
jgi:hypothetical protein